MVWDGSLPAFPIEPLVGRCVSTDSQPESLRLPAIFLHPCFEGEDTVKTPDFQSQVLNTFQLPTCPPDSSEALESFPALLSSMTFS